jgi:TM2 domain-containing membrane protein YozV
LTISGAGYRQPPVVDGTENEEIRMGFVLWLIAVIIGIIGIVQLLQGQIILGIILLVVAFLVGPGGYSVFRSRA